MKGGELLNTKLNALENSVPLTRDELTKMATDLKKTGLEGQALSDALDKADAYGIEVVSMRRDWASVFVEDKPTAKARPRRMSVREILEERRRGLH